MKSDIADLGALILFPPVLTLLLGILVSLGLGPVLPAWITDNAVIWISMTVAMVILPYRYLKRREPSLRGAAVGLVAPPRLQALAIGTVLVGLAVVRIAQGADLPAIVLANLPVAFCEEFWSKGVLFRQARKVFHSDLVVVIVCAAVFAFVTHISSSQLANLLLRFPVGVLTGVIYLRTRSLAWPATLHFTYNALIS